MVEMDVDDPTWSANDARVGNVAAQNETLRTSFEQALMKGGGFVKIVHLSQETLEVCWNMFQPTTGERILHVHAMSDKYFMYMQNPPYFACTCNSICFMRAHAIR